MGNESNITQVQVFKGSLYDDRDDKCPSECYKRSKDMINLNHKRIKLNRVKKYSSILYKLDRYQHNVVKQSIMHIVLAIIISALVIIFNYLH